MADTLLLLKESPFVWVIILLLSTALALIGILINIKKKQLLFLYRTQHIIEKNKVAIDNLTILYANEQVENVMVTKVIFLNKGNTIIDDNDIPAASPLRIKVKENCKILSASILDTSNPASLIELINESPTTIKLKLDYLSKKKDGAIIQIVHTGSNDNIMFYGQLKGGNILTPPESEDSPVAKFSKNFSLFFVRIKKKVYIIILYTLITIMIFAFIKKYDVPATNSAISSAINLIEYLFIGVGIYTLSFMFTDSSRKASWSFLPKKLRKYFY